MAQEWQAKQYSKIIRLHFSWQIASSRLHFIFLSWPDCKQGMRRMPRPPPVPSVQPPPAETVHHNAIFSTLFFWCLGQRYIQGKLVPWGRKKKEKKNLKHLPFADLWSTRLCWFWRRMQGLVRGKHFKKYIINISLELRFDQLLLLSSKTVGNH